MQLSQKEKSLIKDLKDEEKLCFDKYSKYASAAYDPQLKNLFSSIASVEQNHYNSLSQIENGSAPAPSGAQQPCPQFSSAYSASDNSNEKQNDSFLCSDLLATEKHASSLYNTYVFEFKDDQTRKLLAHIQQEEQQHGKMLYDYMSCNGMYS